MTSALVPVIAWTSLWSFLVIYLCNAATHLADLGKMSREQRVHVSFGHLFRLASFHFFFLVMHGQSRSLASVFRSSVRETCLLDLRV